MAAQIISLIAAMAENRIIGRDGKLPWHQPEDLKRFRELTMGCPLIVGRKTFDSIGRPLPGRRMIVLTRQEGYHPAGCLVARDLQHALHLAEGAPEVFIGGGGQVFREAIPLADRIYLTIVHCLTEGDTFFPEIPTDFQEVRRESLPGDPPLTFITFQRGGKP